MTDRLHIQCPSCGGTNRVAGDRLASARCGRCQTALSEPAHPIEVSDAGLKALVGSSPLPVLVDFWAPWCGPCRAVAPQLAKLAADQKGRLLVAKVNTDEHKQTAAALHVQAIPTLAVYQGGRLVKQQAGALMGAQLTSFVAPYLA